MSETFSAKLDLVLKALSKGPVEATADCASLRATGAG